MLIKLSAVNWNTSTEKILEDFFSTREVSVNQKGKVKKKKDKHRKNLEDKE